MLLELAPVAFNFYNKTAGAYQHRFFWPFWFIHWTLSWAIYSEHHYWDRAHIDTNKFSWSDFQHLHYSAFDTIQLPFEDRSVAVRPNCGVGSRYHPILSGPDVQWEASTISHFFCRLTIDTKVHTGNKFQDISPFGQRRSTLQIIRLNY